VSVRGIAFVVVVVRNLDRSVAYYRDILDLQISAPERTIGAAAIAALFQQDASEAFDPADLEYRYVHLSGPDGDPGGFVDLVEFTRPRASPGAALSGIERRLSVGVISRVSFQVASIDDYFADVVARGAAVSAPPRVIDQRGRDDEPLGWFSLQDPDDVTLQFLGPMRQSPA
jgi:catechol 2,3-dioxygenase-like lactoylglutathione lyase family enzyme